MSDRHIPPWDEPVHGYDSGSIGEHFLHRYFPDLFSGRDLARISEVCREIGSLLRDATEYGAAQVRYKFLYPRRCQVYIKDAGQPQRYVGSYYECRFCRVRSSIGAIGVGHTAACPLIDPVSDCTIVLDPP